MTMSGPTEPGLACDQCTPHNDQSQPRGGDVIRQHPRPAAEQALSGADGRHQQAQDHGEPSGMKQ